MIQGLAGIYGALIHLDMMSLFNFVTIDDVSMYKCFDWS